MKKTSKCRAFLASIRTPNLPSVACNVFSGIALAAATSPISSCHAAAAITSGTCLYLAGNLLNDWHDHSWDSIHRPERALPQNIFHASSYLLLAVTLCLIGLLAAVIDTRSLITAIAIIVLILIYTTTHKVWRLSVIPIGLCRSLLPFLGYFACAAPTSEGLHPPKALTLFAIGLFIHVCGLSLIARNESIRTPSAKPRLALAFPIAAALAILAAHKSPDLTRAILATLPYLICCSAAVLPLQKTIPMRVSLLLAVIPLIDWMFLIPMSTGVDATLSAIMLLAPPLACVAGKFLQKIAPAT